MKKILIVFISLLIIFLASVPTSADGYTKSPYNSYNYDEWGKAIYSTDGYVPEKLIYSDVENSIRIKNPKDFYIDDDGNFYILNGKSEGVLILDKNYRLIKNITVFNYGERGKFSLSDPMGIFVKDKVIYIADKGSKEVVICDINGEVLNTLTKPESEMFPQQKEFLPTKVLADDLGNIFVIVEGVYEGAVCFDKNYKFVEFFGSNTVVASASVILQRFWRNFMTEDQREYTAGIVPTEYTGFDIDKEGFIYSCTAVGSGKTNQLRKLNPLGNNVYPQKTYGDLENIYIKGKSTETSFVDVSINEDDMLYALDSAMGRIFVYDSDGQEIFIFGGKSEQMGGFDQPVAIDSFDNRLYVLDSSRSSITSFVLSQYGELVYDATLSYVNGKYTESADLWHKVLRQNENNSLAYVGIGQALYYQGDYDGAREYFKLGGNREQESATFTVWRKAFLRKALMIVIPIVVLIVIITIVLIKVLKRRRKQ